jgi:hypothetical protein
MQDVVEVALQAEMPEVLLREVEKRRRAREKRNAVGVDRDQGM